MKNNVANPFEIGLLLTNHRQGAALVQSLERNVGGNFAPVPARGLEAQRVQHQVTGVAPRYLQERGGLL